MEIILVKEARERGLKRYFTGKPCKHGHVDERKVIDRTCVSCNRDKSRRHSSATKKWREENRDRDLTNKKNHYEDNKEEYYEKAKRNRLDNPERSREYNRKWRRSEKGREQSRTWTEDNRDKHNETVKGYKKRNSGKVLAATRKRQCAKLQRTPSWADHNAITKIYEESARLTEETGILHHVDHDIPLQGEFVSGLHCETNLVILTAADNLSKGNKHTWQNASVVLYS